MKPQPCHQCGLDYIGAICPKCQTERAAYTALRKRMTENDLMQQEREQQLWEALDAIWKLGISPKFMEVILFETGARQWKPPQQQQRAA